MQKIAVEEGRSIDELSYLLIEAPQSFSMCDINGVECLHWVVEKEFSERTFTYFLYPLDDRHYIAFRFYHYFSAGSEDEYLQMEQIAKVDIDRFVSHIFIRSNQL